MGKKLRDQIREGIDSNEYSRKTFDQTALWELADSFDYNLQKIEWKIKMYKWGGWVLLPAIPIVSLLVTYFTTNVDQSDKPNPDLSPARTEAPADEIAETAEPAQTAENVHPTQPSENSDNANGRTSTEPSFVMSSVKNFIPGSVSGVSVLALFLAMLTVLNSVFQPGVRFRRACEIGVEFFHWRCQFLLGLQKFQKRENGGALQYDEPEFGFFLKYELDKFKKLQNADIKMGLPNEDK